MPNKQQSLNQTVASNLTNKTSLTTKTKTDISLMTDRLHGNHLHNSRMEKLKQRLEQEQKDKQLQATNQEVKKYNDRLVLKKFLKEYRYLMAQVFSHSNKELGCGELSKTTYGSSIDNWGHVREYTPGDTALEEEKVDFTVNVLYMLSSLGFVTFRDFGEHFASSFVELKSMQQVSIFKSNFFTLLAAI